MSSAAVQHLVGLVQLSFTASPAHKRPSFGLPKSSIPNNPRAEALLSLILEGMPKRRTHPTKPSQIAPVILTPSPRHAPVVLADMLQRVHEREVTREELSVFDNTPVDSRRSLTESTFYDPTPGGLLFSAAPRRPSAQFADTITRKVNARSSAECIPQKKAVLWGVDPITQITSDREVGTKLAESRTESGEQATPDKASDIRRMRRNNAYQELLKTLPTSSGGSPLLERIARSRRHRDATSPVSSSDSLPKQPSHRSPFSPFHEMELLSEGEMGDDEYNWQATLDSANAVLSDDDDSEFSYVLSTRK